MHYVRDDLDDIDENDIGEKKRFAFLDLLLELSRNGAKSTDQKIQKEVDTIMFEIIEDHDTTAAGSSFVLCVLGIHQDVQERVFEELNEIFGESNRPCTFQDSLEMKYLERVIYETLRHFPSVPAIARHLNNDVKIVTELFITKRLYDFDYRVHRLKEFYPNPDVFDPDNFLPEEKQNRHYYSFISFSAGPRSCVGRKYAILKLKVLLSTILRNYKILSDLTEKDFRLKIDIILKRVDGFQIKIEPRNKSNQEVLV
ncbi:cytochrome P450 4g15-like [Bombus pyrosoma]|uniref:cytochrome P450 4g15-like n=1 Tax=Bombus pyrosoma TaxID=396416 RepID=UPI001CB9CD76|nr:cytochrome P450 4g15-like [Bombus pyrosoma]